VGSGSERQRPLKSLDPPVLARATFTTGPAGSFRGRARRGSTAVTQLGFAVTVPPSFSFLITPFAGARRPGSRASGLVP